MTRAINGLVRKIESQSEYFFDFEFIGESDQDTYGLLCFTQISCPTNLFITEMNTSELAISDFAIALEVIKNRVSNEINVQDLVSLKIIRFDNKVNGINTRFQYFLKTYESPVPIYESIFDHTQEARQVDELSISTFEKLGGQIKFIGSITLSK